MEKKQSLFDFLGPAKSFGFGILMTFLVICSIGFFVLLFSGGNSLSVDQDDVAADFNKPSVEANKQAGNDDNKPAANQINMKDISSSDHIRGDLKTAQVVIVEYSDVDCPFCKRFHPTLKKIVDDYKGKVAWIYRHFPLDSLHPDTRKKSEASECVASLGGNDAFWKFIDSLYENAQDDLPALASAAGVDKAAFNKCLDSGKFKDKVQAQYQDAVTAGGTGTPYAVVVGRDGKKTPIKGALPEAQVKSVIDQMLK